MPSWIQRVEEEMGEVDVSMDARKHKAGINTNSSVCRNQSVTDRTHLHVSDDSIHKDWVDAVDVVFNDAK